LRGAAPAAVNVRTVVEIGVQHAAHIPREQRYRFDPPEVPARIRVGVETRTSSPIRITRGADYPNLDIRGLYPAGEGVSHAGGIYSAAIDGIDVAQALALAMTGEGREPSPKRVAQDGASSGLRAPEPDPVIPLFGLL
jgi:hypothetical protein